MPAKGMQKRINPLGNCRQKPKQTEKWKRRQKKDATKDGGTLIWVGATSRNWDRGKKKKTKELKKNHGWRWMGWYTRSGIRWDGKKLKVPLRNFLHVAGRARVSKGGGGAVGKRTGEKGET